MKTRILRSVLLIAYIGFALSGQLGALQSTATNGASQSATHSALNSAVK